MDYNTIIRKSKENILRRLYTSQKESSKTRNHPQPNYSVEELIDRFIDDEEFNLIFTKFLKRGCVRNEKPSLDWLDDFKPYTLDNLRVTTIRGNELKAFNHRKLGIGTQGKCCKKVAQIDKEGKILNIFPSLSEAARQLGLCRQNINKVCKNERKSAGNFIFKYIK